MNKHNYILLLIVFLALSCNQIVQRDKHQNKETKIDSLKELDLKRKLIERIVFDLNFDDILDTITLSNPPDGDPGIFQTITLSITGVEKQTFEASDVWDEIDEWFLKKNENLVKSNKIFVDTCYNYTYILLFGFPYGSGRDEFSIIKIKDNVANMIFDNQLDYPIQFSDINHDGNIDLIGRNSYEIYIPVDSLNADIGVYSPYLIYSDDNGFKINEQVSKDYNIENYVWAGIKYREDIKILYPRDNGKPLIVE